MDWDGRKAIEFYVSPVRCLKGTVLEPNFFREFRIVSEEKWRSASIRAHLWGFQFQLDTRWNPGLSDEAIAQFESEVEASFPRDFRLFLEEMNGTDKPAVDVRGSSGEPHRFGPGFYSFPRDLRRVQELIDFVHRGRTELCATLREEGFELSDEAALVPVYAHRYVVCAPNTESCPVLSIWDSSDAIVYGKSLKDYLEREVLDLTAG